MDTGFVGGHGRTPLFTHISSEGTQGGSVDFGQFRVDKYSRLTGQVVVDSGGLTLRWRYGVDSGSFVVTSTTVVGTVATLFDELNYARYVDFSFTVIDSTSTYTIQIIGEPLR